MITDSQPCSVTRTGMGDPVSVSSMLVTALVGLRHHEVGRIAAGNVCTPFAPVTTRRPSRALPRISRRLPSLSVEHSIVAKRAPAHVSAQACSYLNTVKGPTPARSDTRLSLRSSLPAPVNVMTWRPNGWPFLVTSNSTLPGAVAAAVGAVLSRTKAVAKTTAFIGTILWFVTTRAAGQIIEAWLNLSRLGLSVLQCPTNPWLHASG